MTRAQYSVRLMNEPGRPPSYGRGTKFSSALEHVLMNAASNQGEPIAR